MDDYRARLRLLLHDNSRLWRGRLDDSRPRRCDDGSFSGRKSSRSVSSADKDGEGHDQADDAQKN